jgi:hypothetical protein
MGRLRRPANRGAAGAAELLRLVEVSIEDVRALQAINKIRAYFSGLVPEAAEYFPAPDRAQAINTMVDIGMHRGRGRGSLTIASSVGVVNTLVCGASVAFAAGDWGLPPAAAAAVGGAVAVVVGWLIFRYQHNRFVGLPRVWLTFFMPGAAGREGCLDAQEVPSGVQA